MPSSYMARVSSRRAKGAVKSAASFTTPGSARRASSTAAFTASGTAWRRRRNFSISPAPAPAQVSFSSPPQSPKASSSVRRASSMASGSSPSSSR